LEAYRRQIIYRVGHIGTKELEIILRDYMTLYGKQMTYSELEQFDSEILDIENPSLQRYLVNQEQVEPEHNTKYVRDLVLYVQNRKKDYAKFTPSIVL
jgi:succinate dehydrogenase flavin-adding protein (antitoxin of CptAB toxin-antitoxin module)